MLIVNYEHIVWNIVKLINNNKINSENFNELFNGYLIDNWYLENFNLGKKVIFEENRLFKYINENEVFKNVFFIDWLIPIKDREEYINLVNQALDYISKVDNELYKIVEILVSNIIITKWDDVWSWSSIKWCFWIITIAAWKKWDYIKIAELLIHESVHLSLYISDMTYNLFNNYKDLQLSETKTLSSVLKIKRPLDSALHASCVSFILYNFYNKIWLKNKSALILKDLKPALIDFDDKYRYLSDYSINLLKEIKSNI
jgi:hypothetical protein